MSTRRAAVTVAAGLALAALPAGASAQAATCGPAEHEGGEWRGYGGDYANTRTQEQEEAIGVADAPTLSPVWTVATTGDVTGTPTVVDGCTYVATTRGDILALNADTGEQVWKTHVPFGGGVNSSVAAAGGRLFVAVTRTSRQDVCAPGDPCVGPYLLALDQDTGDVLWTHQLDTQRGADVYASPVVFDGVVMEGVSGGAAELGDETDRYAFQGSMVFIDAATGELLKKTWTIHPPHEPDDDYAGATIWSTPAIDTEAKTAYVGASNPFRPQAEHAHANAVLKFDVDRSSTTFGEIVASYKGNVDEYFGPLAELPICEDFEGNPPPYYPQGLGACGDLDLDFGASPNLFRGADGRKLVGAGQKSGVYHVFDAETMEPVWTQIVGPPSAVGGIVGSTAYDGESVYGPITIGGYLWSLNGGDGLHRWLAPIGDGAHWGNPVSVANGLVYTVDLHGTLDVFESRTGALVAKHPLALGGTKSPLSVSWGGVSIARNTIYAAVGITGLSTGYVVAFREGTALDKASDVTQTLGAGDAPEPPGGDDGPIEGTAILTGPLAQNYGYLTPVMVVEKGGRLSYTNGDIVLHDVVAREKAADGRPVFQSRLAGLGETVPVEGLDRVESGRTYEFYCSIHPGMQGQLIVR